MKDGPATGIAQEKRSVLDIASSAAREMLDLLPKLSDIHGAARKNVGTALRVKVVRDRLSGCSTPNGDNLLKELQYIAEAADASRHLSLASIESAMQELSREVSKQAAPAKVTFKVPSHEATKEYTPAVVRKRHEDAPSIDDAKLANFMHEHLECAQQCLNSDDEHPLWQCELCGKIYKHHEGEHTRECAKCQVKCMLI